MGSRAARRCRAGMWAERARAAQRIFVTLGVGLTGGDRAGRSNMLGSQGATAVARGLSGLSSLRTLYVGCRALLLLPVRIGPAPVF